jgi:hypothetical protein
MLDGVVKTAAGRTALPLPGERLAEPLEEG